MPFDLRAFGFLVLNKNPNNPPLAEPIQNISRIRHPVNNPVRNQRNPIQNIQKQMNNPIKPMKPSETIQRPISAPRQQMQTKRAPLSGRNSIPMKIQYPKQREEEDSLGSFIDDDDADNYDPLAFKELRQLTGNYRQKYSNYCDEDIPEDGFDSIIRQERNTAHIGRIEDEIEYIKETKRSKYH